MKQKRPIQSRDSVCPKYLDLCTATSARVKRLLLAERQECAGKRAYKGAREGLISPPEGKFPESGNPALRRQYTGCPSCHEYCNEG
jgi:hypothetical protein